MERREASRRLIVNADDFGRSTAINEAVVRAHREGILTSASLMVNEAAFPDAVSLARRNPNLGVGLHLTLIDGHSALPEERIPALANAGGEFAGDPLGTGWRYCFQRACRRQLREEIEAQFEKFRATGLPLDHVNGHLHLHLHPVVFSILMENARRWGITRLRLTCDRLWLNLKLAQGRLGYRISHALIFRMLSSRARGRLCRNGIKHTRAVFGLLQDARVDESFVTRLLSQLPPGDSELYSHPSLGEFTAEFNALISPRARALVEEHGIQLIRYQDL